MTIVRLDGVGPGAPPSDLIAGCDPGLLGADEWRAIDDAAVFIARHRALAAERRVERRAAGREFVERSESGDVSVEELDAWGRALGLGGPGQLVAIVGQAAGASAADLEDVASGLEDLADAAAINHLVVLRGDEVIGLLLAAPEEHAATRCVERFQSLAEPTVRRLGGDLGTASALVTDVAGTIRALHDARRVCQLNRLTAPAQASAPQPAAELPLILRMLGDAAARPLAALRAVVLDPIRDYDLRHGTELVRTLDVFLSTGCQWGVSAARLGIHVNTLRYRLARIEKCTGIDPSSTAARVDFYLALRSADVPGESWPVGGAGAPSSSSGPR
ncbi:MAG: helix-turn-helix domain-containing protein [Patulibacter sp.]